MVVYEPRYNQIVLEYNVVWSADCGIRSLNLCNLLCDDGKPVVKSGGGNL